MPRTKATIRQTLLLRTQVSSILSTNQIMTTRFCHLVAASRLVEIGPVLISWQRQVQPTARPTLRMRSLRSLPAAKFDKSTTKNRSTPRVITPITRQRRQRMQHSPQQELPTGPFTLQNESQVSKRLYHRQQLKILDAHGSRVRPLNFKVGPRTMHRSPAKPLQRL